jgi:hypothetical protein
MPPAFMRSAASAKSLIIRSMSQSSAFFGKARCAASRRCDGEMTGSQSPLSHRAAAEMGKLDHHRRAMLVHGVGQFPDPRHDLVLVGEDVVERGGLSLATAAEPAVMVSATPPFARST